MTECRCGRPTRDERYSCDACSDDLSKSLGEIPWLVDEIEVSITKRKGLDYRKVGGATGGKKAGYPSPPEWGAAEARGNLRAVMVSWVRFCEDEHVRHQSHMVGLPDDDLKAMSRWLLWRVDGLALLDIGPEAVDEITSAVAHCRRLIDRPADKQYLGDCQVCAAVGEQGRLYVRPGSAMARCQSCGDTVDAETLRAGLLRELDDRLCTAAEVAELSTYLGLHDDRERVRKRIERWGANERHPLVRVKVNGQDHYRFGAAYVALMEHENRRERESA